MGYYVNPPNGSKEEWVARNAIQISEFEFKSYDYRDKELVPLCMVDNGPFRALAVAFDANERDSFVHPDDFRPKLFFLAEVEKVREVSRGFDSYFK